MTDALDLALLTRLYEALGEKPPEHAFYYPGGIYIVNPGLENEYYWPCERVDWNALHLLAEKTAQKHEDWNIAMSHYGRRCVLSIYMGDGKHTVSSGSQPADMLEAFRQAVGIA